MSLAAEHSLTGIINSTFLSQCGKGQLRKEVPQAFLLRFRTTTDYAKEEGYRFLEVVLYAPMNYVQVWVRKSWDVIPREDLEYDENDDSRIKRGKSYQKGKSAWELVMDHDSGWRDAVRKIVQRDDLDSLDFARDAIGAWFSVVPVNSILPTEVLEGKARS